MNSGEHKWIQVNQGKLNSSQVKWKGEEGLNPFYHVYWFTFVLVLCLPYFSWAHIEFLAPVFNFLTMGDEGLTHLAIFFCWFTFCWFHVFALLLLASIEILIAGFFLTGGGVIQLNHHLIIFCVDFVSLFFFSWTYIKVFNAVEV